MKRKFIVIGTCVAAIVILGLVAFTTPEFGQREQQTNSTKVQENDLEGAWRLTGSTGKGKAEGLTTIKLVQDGFFTVAVYDMQNKKFLGSYGGTYTITNGKLTESYEFSTFDAAQVGKTATGTTAIKNGKWHTTGLSRGNKGSETWEKLNEQTSKSPLQGTWRITGREVKGEMSTMRPGPRKTLKVLSGTRFQWIAFNSETGEFSGTGGGTYTAQDGKYTENIEFFSRDSSRVGMQLSFNYELKNGRWHHTGQSSTGNKVNEIWERMAVK